jgi:hypothetical protein
MTTPDQLRNQVERATQRLANLKARELLAEHRASHQAKIANRRADAHRKIELGGLFLATETGSMEKAELAGVLLSYRNARAQQGAALIDRMRSQGAAHLAHRDALRKSTRKG